MVLDFGLRPVEVTLSQTVFDKLKQGQAQAWLHRIKNPLAAEIDLAANFIHVVPKWEYVGPSADIVVKLQYKDAIFKLLSEADNDTVYVYEDFWHDVLMHENLCQTAGHYKPHVVPLELLVSKDDVIIAQASIQVHYEPPSWHFNAQVNLVSQKMIYQRPENPKVKVFWNTTSQMSAGTITGLIKSQAAGASVHQVNDPLTEWTEIGSYWDEMDYNPDGPDAPNKDQIWYDTLTFELTNTPDQTAFQVPVSFTAYSSVAIAFTPEGNGHGLRITDIIVDSGGDTTFTSFSLYDPNAAWNLEEMNVPWMGATVSAYRPTRGAYDPGNNSPVYPFRFRPIFTGGGQAMISVEGSADGATLVDVSEMIFFSEDYDYNAGVTSGTDITGTIDISAGDNPDWRVFKFFMTVDGVTSPIIYMNVGWA
jgi:hypothetical protein